MVDRELTRDEGALPFEDHIGWRQTNGPDVVVKSGLLFEFDESNVVLVRFTIVRFVHVDGLGCEIAARLAHLGKVVLA